FYFFMPYLFRKGHEYMTMYNNIERTHAGDLSYMYYKDYEDYSKRFFKNYDLYNITIGEFENEGFIITVNYDNIIKTQYVHYMVLPKESERKRHKIEYSTFD